MITRNDVIASAQQLGTKNKSTEEFEKDLDAYVEQERQQASKQTSFMLWCLFLALVILAVLLR